MQSPGVYLKAVVRPEIQYRWAQKCVVLNTDTVPTVLDTDQMTAALAMAYCMRMVLRKLAIRVCDDKLLALMEHSTSCSGAFGGSNTVFGKPFRASGMSRCHGTRRRRTSRRRKPINQQVNASSTRRSTGSETGIVTQEQTLSRLYGSPERRFTKRDCSTPKL